MMTTWRSLTAKRSAANRWWKSRSAVSRAWMRSPGIATASARSVASGKIWSKGTRYSLIASLAASSTACTIERCSALPCQAISKAVP